MPDRILNIATYRFTPLADLPALRQRLFDTAEAHAVRGTVLLAEEGINLCLAGPPDGDRVIAAGSHSPASIALLIGPVRNWRRGSIRVTASVGISWRR